jgi:glutamate-1-semialdehyde aminotransferase
MRKDVPVYPVGAATYSKHPSRYAKGAPRLVGAARGAWVWPDGRRAHEKRLVDMTSGMGAVILGHQYPDVQAAVLAQAKKGVAFPLPTRLEERTAERLVSLLTWERAQSVRWGKNGADATGSAVRLARATTGRKLIAYFDYHGHHDWSVTEPPWNGGVLVGETHSQKVASLDEIESPSECAAVILEAVSSASGDHRRHDFQAIRQWCDAHGALFILDEMVTGFRMAPGGAAQAMGIEPDIACYGKAIANGLPLSAVVGPWDIMRRYEEHVFYSVTHGGEALSLAAAEATMRVLVDKRVTKRIGEFGVSLKKAAPQLFKLQGYSQRLLFRDPSKLRLERFLEGGVLTAGYFNLTLAHVEDAEARALITEAVDMEDTFG